MMERKLDLSLKEARTDNLAVRLNATEREMLEALANHLQRSQSDTVRLVIRGAVQALMGYEQEGDSGHAGVDANKEEVRK